MVEQIQALAFSHQFLERITSGNASRAGNTALLKKLPKYDALSEFEESLKKTGDLSFSSLYKSPIGNYLVKTYLLSEHSVDKAVFISDVELFKKLRDPSARQGVAERIFMHFLAPESRDHIDGCSVFSTRDGDMPWYAHKKTFHELEISSIYHPNTQNQSSFDLKNRTRTLSGTHTQTGTMTTHTHHHPNGGLTKKASQTEFTKTEDDLDTQTQIVTATPAHNHHSHHHHHHHHGHSSHHHPGGGGGGGGGGGHHHHPHSQRGGAGKTVIKTTGPKNNQNSASPPASNPNGTLGAANNSSHLMAPGTPNTQSVSMEPSHSSVDTLQLSSRKFSLLTDNSNTIGVYGRPIDRVRKRIENGETMKNDLFDDILNEVMDDLRLDVFPRFCRSNHYKMYIRCRYLQTKKVSHKDFLALRPLGRGAFGFVHACEKRDSGKLYAMKQINKRRVQATDSIKTIMQERDYLAMMDSNFVTTLKYAMSDANTLYLIIDLMLGGDMKYHLNSSEKFSEERTRFHVAEVLLGLEHMHSKYIVYRDLKLENVLVDEDGHCKISDLGLAVQVGPYGSIRGYAGTPGYTAPEVVLGFNYDWNADFFSYGVLIYRCLCGRKPFEKRGQRKHRGDDRGRKKSSQLDRNVIEMEPEFSATYFTPQARSLLKGLMCKHPKRRLGYHGIQEIKDHPWFDPIDFGLLEAGYLESPFMPKLEKVHAPMSGHQAPPQDAQYGDVKITPEFEKQLAQFEYISKSAIQEEIVDVLKTRDKQLKDTGRYQLQLSAADSIMGGMGSGGSGGGLDTNGGGIGGGGSSDALNGDHHGGLSNGSDHNLTVGGIKSHGKGASSTMSQTSTDNARNFIYDPMAGTEEDEEQRSGCLKKCAIL